MAASPVSRTQVVDLGTMSREQVIEVARKQANKIREKNKRITALMHLLESETNGALTEEIINQRVAAEMEKEAPSEPRHAGGDYSGVGSSTEVGRPPGAPSPPQASSVTSTLASLLPQRFSFPLSYRTSEGVERLEEEQRATVDSLLEELAAREAAAAEARERAERLETAVMEQQGRMSMLEAELAASKERTRIAMEREATVAAEAPQPCEACATLKTKLAEWKAKTKVVITEAEAARTALEVDVAALRTTVAERDAQLETLAAASAEVESLRAELDALKQLQQIVEKKQASERQACDGELEELRVLVTSLREELAAHEAAAVEARERTEQLETTVAEQEDRVSLLEAELASTAEKLKLANIQWSTRETKLDEPRRWEDTEPRAPVSDEYLLGSHQHLVESLMTVQKRVSELTASALSLKEENGVLKVRNAELTKFQADVLARLRRHGAIP